MKNEVTDENILFIMMQKYACTELHEVIKVYAHDKNLHLQIFHCVHVMLILTEIISIIKIWYIVHLNEVGYMVEV